MDIYALMRGLGEDTIEQDMVIDDMLDMLEMTPEDFEY